MIRWLGISCVSLIAGVLLTAATACCCALWMPLPAQNVTEWGERVGGLRMGGAPGDFGRKAVYTTRLEAAGPGVRYTREWHERSTVGYCVIHSDGPYESCATGWPLKALVSSDVQHLWVPPPSWHVAPVGWRRASGTPQSRFVPLSVAAGGFAVNSLFFGGAVFGSALLTAAGRKMWRARRGLCRSCAYPVISSAICPECGRAP